jgi:phosphomannomutase/phosphoglucomutase
VNAVDKLSIKVGAMPVSILLLLLTVAAVFGLTTAFDDQQQQQVAAQQHQIKTLSAALDNAVNAQAQQLTLLAKSPELNQLLNEGSQQQIAVWSKQTSSLLPQVEKICVLLQEVKNPTNDACLPISFATLSSLRQLGDKRQSDLAMMQPNQEQAHILLAHRFESNPNYPQAKLLMAVNSSWIDSVIDDAFVNEGYVEITQGTKTATALTQVGQPQFKNGAPAYTANIKNTLWQLQIWTKPSANAGSTLLITLLSVLIVVLWLLRDSWFSKLLKRDTQTFHEQLSDLEQEKLKHNYAFAFSPLKQVRDHIQKLVIPKRPPPKKMQAAEVEEIKPQVTEQEIPPSADAEKIVEQALDTVSKQKPAEATPEPKPEPKPEPEPKKEDSLLEFSLEQVEREEPLDLSPTANQKDEAGGRLPDKAIFRNYDIRGVVDKQLSADVMHQLGQSVGSEALEQGQTKMVVGRDGRLSSQSLSEAFIGGVLSTGCDVVVLGEVPTPLVYFACEHLETHTGAMITGSHNPTNFNGLKVVIAGKTLVAEGVYQLYERLEQKKLKKGQGQRTVQDISEAYIERIKADVTLSRPMKVVVDCGNGVAGHIAGELLRAVGCDVSELYCEVDGNFPNHHPDPGQPENMQDLIQVVQSQQAELGLAFDGDGDRLGVVDAQGNIIWPDRLLLLIAQHLLVEQPGATVIYDVKSTNLLEAAITKSGGRAVMSPSGHSVIKKMMTEENAMLAGEMTGHLFFKDRWYGFDDALYSAARLLELLAADQLERTPTDIFAALPQRVSTPEIIIQMQEGESAKFIEQMQASTDFTGGKLSTVDGIRVDYPYGWGLVRASNTVPGLTLRFEASSNEELEQIKQAFIEKMLQVKPTMSLLF